MLVRVCNHRFESGVVVRHFEVFWGRGLGEMVGWFVSDLRGLSQGLGSEGFFFFGLCFFLSWGRFCV